MTFWKSLTCQVAKMCLKFSSLSLPNFPCCPAQTISGQGSIYTAKNLIRLVSFILFSEIFDTVNKDTGYLLTYISTC